MSSIVSWMLNWINRCPTPGNDKYHLAMQSANDLMDKMQENRDHPTREIVTDIMANRHNTPYITTVYETVQELNSPIKQNLNGSGRKTL